MSDNKISIIHTNDMHSQINNLSKSAYIINAIRQKNNGINTLLTNSGDALVGSIYYTLYKGEVESKLLNMLGYDMITLGNHEFDGGSVGVDFFLDKIDAEIVLTNVDFTKNKTLNKYINKKIFQNKIYKLGSKKVAFLGLLTLDTRATSSMDDDIIMIDPKDFLEQEIRRLKDEGIDTIIILSHLGIDQDQIIARQFNDIDVIVGGHTHSLIDEPLIINNTIIVQAGSNGKYIGELELDLDNILNYNYKLYELDKHSDIDLKVQEYIDYINLEIDKVSNEVIGKADVYLNGEREVVRNEESNLGNLIADAFYFSAKQEGYNPDFAIINGAGIRSPIGIGDIRYKDIVNVLPFNRYLAVAEVTGEQLKESIESGFFLQVAKLKLVKKENKIDVFYLQNGEYVEIVDEQVYILATNDYVINCNDRYTGFKNSKILRSNVMEDVKVVVEYIKYLDKPINYKIEDRIVLK